MISVSTARPLTYGGWSAEHLDAAVCAVQRDGVSIRRAAITYGLPKSTLYDHVSGKVSRLAKPGPKPYLSEEEEEGLVNFLVKCAQIGYPQHSNAGYSNSTRNSELKRTECCSNQRVVGTFY